MQKSASASWRVHCPAHPIPSPSKFGKGERFLIEGQGGKARQAAEIRNGQKKVIKLLGSQYKKEYIVQRKDKFWSSPRPVYVKLKTKDELDPSINPQLFSKYRRFVPSLQFTNQIKDGGFHKLTGLAAPIYADSRAGYIKPIQQSQARLKKSAIKAPPHTYLGLGLHMADLERPKSVAFDIRDRFDDTMERLKVKTPGPGNYKRPADSCHIHNPNSLSIPFWKTVNDGSLAHRRKKQQEYHSLSPAQAEAERILFEKRRIRRIRRLGRTKRYKGGGGGVKFSSYVEPSMMFSLKNRHLGPGCYRGAAQAVLDLEPTAPVLKFRPLAKVRPKTTPSGSRSRKNDKQILKQCWPREDCAERPEVNKDNFMDHFWELESRQNGRDEEEDE